MPLSPIRQGKAYSAIKFTVTKTDGRTVHDDWMRRKAAAHKRRTRSIAGDQRQAGRQSGP